MPRAPKPRDVRANREKRDVGTVELPSDDLEVPKPPPGLLASTRQSWERYWRSPARNATVIGLDLDLLERLWTLYDERTRAQRELRKARVIKGSKGQDRPSGFYIVLRGLDSEIARLEDRVAKSMKSRLVLGMVVGGDGRAAPPAEPDLDDVGANVGSDGPPDPRLYLVDRQAG